MNAVASGIRIFDTFLFDGELDLLEHRLRQNFDATYAFVLVEAEETYRGEKKPLIFAANQDRFKWAAGKIRHVSLRQLGSDGSSPRARAEAQRNAVLLGLHDASAEDVVLLLDADEIPSLALLQELARDGLREPHRIQMTRHYQRLDLLAPASTCCIDRGLPFSFARGRKGVAGWSGLDAAWSGRSGVAAPVGAFRTASAPSPYLLRFGPGVQKVLPDGGRHLTAVDPSARLDRKLGRVFHAEWATERGMYGPHLRRCERYGVHHRGWWYAERPTGPLPADLVLLVQRSPSMLRSEALPALWKRRLVRTWAWMRQAPVLPDATVRWVDRNFRLLLPLLTGLLLLADGARWIAARLGRGRSPRAALDGHAHH